MSDDSYDLQTPQKVFRQELEAGAEAAAEDMHVSSRVTTIGDTSRARRLLIIGDGGYSQYKIEKHESQSITFYTMFHVIMFLI